MATGKSTIGRILAERLAVPFLDTDALLVEQTGKAVSELFSSEGEALFRDREAALVLPMLSDPTPRVIGFGGGTATIPRVRHAALEAATLVTLTASPETVVARVTSLAGRPNLLTSSPLLRASDLLTLRREAYDAASRGNTKQIAGGILGGVGAVSAVVGVYLLLQRPHGAETARKASRLAVDASPLQEGGGLANATLSF